jgi:hypothetical protein
MGMLVIDLRSRPWIEDLREAPVTHQHAKPHCIVYLNQLQWADKEKCG